MQKMDFKDDSGQKLASKENILTHLKSYHKYQLWDVLNYVQKYLIYSH